MTAEMPLPELVEVYLEGRSVNTDTHGSHVVQGGFLANQPLSMRRPRRSKATDEVDPDHQFTLAPRLVARTRRFVRSTLQLACQIGEDRVQNAQRGAGLFLGDDMRRGDANNMASQRPQQMHAVRLA